MSDPNSVGLFAKEGGKQAVPLKAVDISGNVNCFLSTINLIQTFQNDGEAAIEVEYRFPILDNSVISSLSIELEDGRVVQAKIEEKESAQEKFGDKIARGHQVYMGSQDPNQPDRFVLTIGNLPSGHHCKVMIKIESPLTCELDNWTLILPANFLQSNLDVKATLNLDISMKSNITELTTPGFDSTITASGNSMNVTCDALPIGGSELTLKFKTEEAGKPTALLQRNETGQLAGMISFIPNFLEPDEDEDDLEGTGEFIILIDRSGSMWSGQRMQLARDAAIFFVKSLPVNSKFNVISYGSNRRPMFPESVDYTQQNVNQAVDQIRNFEADMGGNNEYGPLAWIFSTTPTLPRNIFLISDGGVENAQALYNICRSNVHNARLHAFGIGSGAEADIIRNLAKSGKGVCEMVVEGESFQNKVIGVLKKAIVPALSNWKITTDTETEVEFAPSAQIVPNLYAGESFQLYARLDSSALPKAITMTCINTKSMQEETYSVEIDPSEEQQGDSVHKLWAKMRINEFEHFTKIGQDKKSDIQALSIEYQIPSSQTAFIASARNIDPVTGDVEFKNIPVTESTFSRGYGSMSDEECSECDSDDYSGGGGGGGGGSDSDDYGGGGGGSDYGMKENCLKGGGGGSDYEMSDNASEDSYGTGGGGGGYDSGCEEAKLSAAPMMKSAAAAVAMPSVASAACAVAMEQSMPRFSEIQPSSSGNLLMDIIASQTVMGNWDSDILPILSLATNKPEGIDDEAWATVAVMAFLHARLSEKEAEWSLVAKKAIRWLKKKGVDFKTYEISFN